MGFEPMTSVVPVRRSSLLAGYVHLFSLPYQLSYEASPEEGQVQVQFIPVI